MNIRTILNISFFIVSVVLICSETSASNPTHEEMSYAELKQRRKQLYELPWYSISSYFEHATDVSSATSASSASENPDYDVIIMHAGKALDALDALEISEQAHGRIFRKESNLHISQYANLAGAYDRKGFCFHAYWYYNRFMDAKNSDFIIVGFFRYYVLDKTADSELYEQEKPLYISILDWNFLPFKRCIPEKYMDNMFSVDETEAVEYKAIRSFSNKLKRINHEYNKCKSPVVWKRGPERDNYLERKKTCGETAAEQARAALEVVADTKVPEMREACEIIMSKSTFGEIRVALSEYIERRQGNFGPVPRVLRWVQDNN